MKKVFIIIFLFLILAGLLGYKYFIVENVLPDKKDGQQLLKLGDNAIYVADQKPGSLININYVSLEKSGYVIIHEDLKGKLGSIAGSTKILSKGELANIPAVLLRPVSQGEVFYAVLYEDSGDGIFSPNLDAPLRDEEGNIMSMKFYIDRNAPEPGEIIINPALTTAPDLSDLIKLYEPLADGLIKSPTRIKGEARGFWYFEASFPIRIYDADGKELGVAVAQAKLDPADSEATWMTEDFVPFDVVLNFKKPLTNAGTLVLEKDNPSGLPENANELRVPVRFDLESWPGQTIAPTISPIVSGGCKVTGCSGQVCSEEEVITTCEYKDEYACYKTANCERQEDGKCGWTPSEELVACLRSAWSR